jgi:hypothetical protein
MHCRLTTVSVNNVETVMPAQSLIDGEWVMCGFINVAPGLADPRGWPMERHTYRTVGEVDTITFVGPDGLLDLLEVPGVAEAARRLAIGLTREGRGMMAKYHDESLADDVFSVLLGSGQTLRRRYGAFPGAEGRSPPLTADGPVPPGATLVP